MPKQPKVNAEQLVLDLIMECNTELKSADETIKEIYEQYRVTEADTATLAVLGQHVNKTAELKLKSISEKVKLAEILHRIESDRRQLDLAAQIAKQRQDQQASSDMNDLYGHQDEEEGEVDNDSGDPFPMPPEAPPEEEETSNGAKATN